VAGDQGRQRQSGVVLAGSVDTDRRKERSRQGDMRLALLWQISPFSEPVRIPESIFK